MPLIHFQLLSLNARVILIESFAQLDVFAQFLPSPQSLGRS